MRIGIDARFFGSIGKGLGRYTQKLIENLEAIDEHNHYFVFLRRKNWDEYKPRRKNFTKVLADVSWYTLQEQIRMPQIIKKCGLDLVHFPHFNVPIAYRGKFIVTIHDLILFHYPTRKASSLSPLMYSLKKSAYRRVINHAVKKSEKIIAVSNHTKKDILKHFRVRPEKITVTYEAVDALEKPPSLNWQNILRKYGIMKPYLLYVGNAYPHKNLERLVLVFRNLVKKYPHLHLALVGKEDYFYKRLKNFVRVNEIKQIIFTDFVPDEDLPTVYREAKLYVFPSLYEGFGLPPFEAMARSLPVASSSSSCLPEILESAAAYFDPKGISEMEEIIEKVLTDNSLRKNLIETGKRQIRKYSWEKMARETLSTYQDCAQLSLRTVKLYENTNARK